MLVGQGRRAIIPPRLSLLTMSTVRFKCFHCGNAFGTINGPREPRVLPCGDSLCKACLSNLLEIGDSFNCRKCMELIERDCHFPVNKLYYEMQAQWKEVDARREWENPPEGQTDPAPAQAVLIPASKRCLNPFCGREPYQMQHISELFCSRRCWEEWERLSEIV